MFLTRPAQLFSNAILSVAFPQPCVLCGRSVERREFGVACEACWSLAKIFNGSEVICWKCGVTSLGAATPFNSHEIRCHRCDEEDFSVARACGVYEGALREAVLHLKREPYIPAHLVKLLVATAGRTAFTTATRLMPVPLHPERQQSRGFNQAGVIAAILASALKLPSDEVSLSRIGSSEKHRAGLDSKGRHDSVAGAFKVNYPELVRDENVLLIDDVFTTGATVSSCSRVLRAAGVREVLVLTIARPAC